MYMVETSALTKMESIFDRPKERIIRRVCNVSLNKWKTSWVEILLLDERKTPSCKSTYTSMLLGNILHSLFQGMSTKKIQQWSVLEHPLTQRGPQQGWSVLEHPLTQRGPQQGRSVLEHPLTQRGLSSAAITRDLIPELPGRFPEKKKNKKKNKKKEVYTFYNFSLFFTHFIF